MTLNDGRIASVEVTRAAPCGATHLAALKVVGLSPPDAISQLGLEAQFHCVADPSNWDPIHGKSPVHFAGRIHSLALERAIKDLG